MAEALARFVVAWQLVVRQAIAHWRLLSAVVVGVMLASTIMAATVVYFDALKELALKSALASRPPAELDILMKTERGPTNYVEAERVSSIVDRFIDGRVGWMVEDRITAVRSATFFPTTPENLDLAGKDDSRSYFAFLPGLNERIRVLPGGRPPREEALSPPGEPLVLEALVPVENARMFGVEVGDRLMAVPYWTEDVPHATVIVSGLFERTDPADDFWYIDDGMLQAATRLTSRTVPFFISEETFMEVLGGTFRDMTSAYGWLLDVDPDTLTAGNALEARINVEAMKRELGSFLNSFLATTEVDEVLADYDRRLFFTRLPMFIVLILIAVVVLYYVVTLAALLVDHRRGEIALLRSRGATSVQVLSVFALEGATIALAAALLGPWLAAAAVSVLGLAPSFSDLSGSAVLASGLSGNAYLMSGIGGLLSFAALMIPAVQASRVGVTLHRQQLARPSALPAFQRYYIDVVLLIVAVVLFRQLSEQGSVVGTRVFGQYTVNQLQLAVPAIGLVAGAMVLLRLFPLVMNLTSRLFSRWLPAGVALALWQMARNPTHYARLSLLLILTAGLGMFAASFGGTLEKSFEERVLYETGSEIRVEGILRNNSGVSRAILGGYESLPGVDQVASVYRGGGYDVTKLLGEPYVMLAVDSAVFNDIAWFRDDFSSDPMNGLIQALPLAERPEGVILPESARALQLTVKPDRTHISVRVVARAMDANGRYFTYPFGMLESPDWIDLEASFEVSTRGFGRRRLQPTHPLTLVSIAVQEIDVQRKLGAGSILVDEIRVRLEGGDVQVIEPFDGVDGWSVLRATPDAISDDLRASSENLNGHSASAMFTWSEGRPIVGRGIFFGPPVSSVPVLANEKFMDDSGYSEGDTIQVSVGGHRVFVKLVDTISYFPTMDTYSDGFLVADLGSLQSYANLEPSTRELTPNEMWISTAAAGPERDRLVDALATDPFTSRIVFDRVASLEIARVDPLVQAGWRALLFLAFAAVLILSGVGFLVHSYVSFRKREPEFALLKTIGLSNRQLLSLVWLEPVLIIVVGMALGTEMGRRLGTIIIPFLGHDDQGSQVLPPFTIETNWANLGITYAAMAVVFVAVILVMMWFVRKLSLQRLLRLGET